MKKVYLVLIILLTFFTTTACSKENNKDTLTNDLNVVTSLEDTISDNTVWCGSFNIVWNELKENAKSEISVTPSQEQVTNLNNTKFSKDSLNENSYYVTHGKQTPEFKAQIEKNIKNKFNQTSDILDKLQWEKDSSNELYYSMLYKKFNFETPFKELEKTTYNGKGEYKYFGINSKTRTGSYQVNVLYYEDENNFAVKIDTKENDEILLLKSSDKKDNFLEYYNDIKEKSDKFNGKKKLDDEDTLYVPYIKFNTYKEFDNLVGILVEYKNGEKYKIGKALQTIKLELNESGGEIKSEAAISVENAAIEESKPRHFNFTSDFIMFLKEEEKELPYFAANINSLDEFQNN